MDKATRDYYEKLGIEPSKGWEIVQGVPNKSANLVKIKEETWSDTNLDSDYLLCKIIEFEKLKCKCGSISFEIFRTGDYETSARCQSCKFWYIVHSG